MIRIFHQVYIKISQPILEKQVFLWVLQSADEYNWNVTNYELSRN